MAAYLRRAVQEEDKTSINLGTHHIVPACSKTRSHAAALQLCLLSTVKVVLVARKAVNQELRVRRVVHGLLNEPTGDLDGHNLAIFDVTVDQVSQVRTGVATLW